MNIAHLRKLSIVTVFVASGLAAFAVVTAQQPQAQQAPAKAAKGRLENRTYVFKEAADRDQAYSIYVPSTYDKEKKTPLIVALHGLGGNPQRFINTRGLTDGAEKYGYIVVAPFGYNERGWYGARSTGGRGAGKTPDVAKNGAPAKAGEAAKTEAKQGEAKVAGKTEGPGQVVGKNAKGGGKGRGGKGGGGNASDPPNLGELSEKDVLNVLELVRKEYNIDSDRIYLMGHSMGGGGTLYLGPKYGDIWAALAPFAPAIGNNVATLEKVKQIPIIVVQGDNDTLVNVRGTRNWVNKMKELDMTYEYIEVAGGTHGDVVAPNIPKMFDFFNKHTKATHKK